MLKIKCGKAHFTALKTGVVFNEAPVMSWRDSKAGDGGRERGEEWAARMTLSLVAYRQANFVLCEICQGFWTYCVYCVITSYEYHVEGAQKWVIACLASQCRN